VDLNLVTLVDVSCAALSAAAPQTVALAMSHGLRTDLASHLQPSYDFKNIFANFLTNKWRFFLKLLLLLKKFDHDIVF
jgi:superfamily II DNA helicase RecQ